MILSHFAGRFVVFSRAVVGLVIGRRALAWVGLSYYFSIRLEVFLLINVHCKYYLINSL
jgi:hypothetical protein